jgi:hypothetical protein
MTDSKGVTPAEVSVAREHERPADEPSQHGVRKLIYRSSNGDCWFLAQTSIAGGREVVHVPNPASGGMASHTGIEIFLAGAANGPEHQALRSLLENAGLATILITYDIHPAQGSTYDELGKAIQSLGDWWHHLETVWIVRSDRGPGEIRDGLKAYIGTDDQLLVVDITGDEAEWIGVSDTGSIWLDENLAADGDMFGGAELSR